MHISFKYLVAGALALCTASAYATPKIQHWQSPSGAKVMFVEDHNIPMVDIAVTFAAGSSFDSSEKSGVASLTHKVMSLGADGLTDNDISRRMADIGALFGGNFDMDRASKTLRTLSKPEVRNQALEVMAKVVQQPTFPEAIVQREKARVVASLKEAETKPEPIAEKAFQKAIYGVHPYALHPAGEVSSVESISVQDLQNFYRTFYQSSRAVVAIMGDVSRADAEAIAQQLTAQLPTGNTPTDLAAVVMQSKASEQRIPHPASQSHILVGAPGIARNDPDYFPLFVGNYILGGGGFVSRLMNEVREKRGLAYSVHSYFMPMKQPGPFQIGLQTKKEQANEALQLVRNTLSEFVTKGPNDKELLAAKQNLVGGFPLRIDSNSKILEYLSVIGFYSLPLTYLDDFTQNIEKVTVKDVQQAFARNVKPDAMATIIVGAPEAKEAAK